MNTQQTRYNLTMKIRRFTSTDTPDLIELFRHTVHTVCTLDYSPEQLNAWAPQSIDTDKWTLRFARTFTVVAESEGQLVGFANLADDGCVDMLYVTATMQSQGVATRLISVLEDEARRLGIKRLYSDVSLTARKFFLSKGFTLENEYSKKVGEVIFPNAIMGKQLG